MSPARFALIALVAVAFSAKAEETLSFYISNHDQSPEHRVVHPIVGRTNFVYDAEGALEKIRGEAIAFYVRDSENVTIRNLRLDWERPCMTEARIVDVEDGETVVEIDRGLFPVAFIGGRMWMTGPGWTNDTELCAAIPSRSWKRIFQAGSTRPPKRQGCRARRSWQR